MPDVIAGLGVDRPLVYATLGTAFNDPETMKPFFSALQEGLADAPVDLLLTLGSEADPAALGEPRPGVRVVTFVPQRAVLDRCAVVVCHGGYGTVLDAIDAAVPLVIVPFGADQFVNAEAVERVGIGIAVTSGRSRRSRSEMQSCRCWTHVRRTEAASRHFVTSGGRSPDRTRPRPLCSRSRTAERGEAPVGRQNLTILKPIRAHSNSALGARFRLEGVIQRELQHLYSSGSSPVVASTIRSGHGPTDEVAL